MAAVERGVALIDRAKPIAARYLQYQAGVRANLILAGSRPRAVLEQASSNFGALRDELSAALPVAQRLDVQAALNKAGDIFDAAAGKEGQRRELVIVSDFQRSSWSIADFSRLPKDTLIQLESVAPAQPLQNLGILRVAAGRVEQGQSTRLEVDVGNYSSTARQVEVDVTIGATACRLQGLCPPRVKSTLTAEVLLTAAGWQAGEARLVGVEDALAADNVRYFVVQVQPPAVYALLTRDPTKPQATSSHFIERALSPALPRGESAKGRVVRIDPMSMDRDALSAADLLVIDHPGKLAAPQINLLTGLLRRGRPVLYVAAEATDALNLKLLMDAAGSDLRMPVEFMPQPAGSSRKDLFLSEVSRESAPFSVFGENLSAAMAPLRFTGALMSRPLRNGLADDIRGSYSDRSACIILTPCGAGMLAVWNVDLNGSNLPASPAFVPLAGEIVNQLLSQRRAESAGICGETLAVYLPPDSGTVAGLQIQSPANGTEAGALAEDAGFVLWRWNCIAAPGVYRVKRDEQTIFAMGAGLAPEESDLATLDPSVLKKRLAGGRPVQFRSVADERQQRDDTWAWLLVACAVCLLAECTALRAFRT